MSQKNIEQCIKNVCEKHNEDTLINFIQIHLHAVVIDIKLIKHRNTVALNIIRLPLQIGFIGTPSCFQ